MPELHLDFETRSELDLLKVGAYRYAEHESTEILMAAYSLDDGPVKIWVPAEGEDMPFDLEEYFDDPDVTIPAWNANFERCIIAAKLPNGTARARPHRFRCAMVDGMSIGLPGKLEKAGEALGLGEDKAKMKDGRRLITKFCKPRKPTKRNPDRWWTAKTAPDDWALFKSYCIRDVEAERTIWHKTKTWRMPEIEQRLWVIDQEINDRGLAVDMALVFAAKKMGDEHKARLFARSQALTGLDNPNSRDQLIEWLNSTDDFDPEEDSEVEDLRKKTVEKILGREDLSEVVREVLELRRQIAKSSLKKYDTLIRAVCDDGRIRGTMQFCGANRTGRWAGRLLQVQNLPQGNIEDVELLALTRELVKIGDYDALYVMWDGNISDMLATLIRTCLVAPAGSLIAAADFSAIEARVLAWFANCRWRLEIFRTHGKIYEASASTMFKIPFSDFEAYKKRTGKHHPARKKGKVSELALGYQGGENALITMGALDQGILREELLPMVDAWRDANTEIAGVKNEKGWRENGFWQKVEGAAKLALRTGKRQEVLCGDGLRAKLVFRVAGGMLIITLPSGRHLHYYKARLTRTGKGREQIQYWGVNQKTKQWQLLDTYGGKLVENIVQAFSRDCLREAMFKLHELGYPMTMLVHDEIVFELLITEIEAGRLTLDEILAVMAEEIPYAPGLPLKGAGYTNPFYFKD